MRGIFVTGTDTGVGKTVVSAALMIRHPQARYWKPVQTGIETDDDTAEVRRLTGRLRAVMKACGCVTRSLRTWRLRGRECASNSNL